MTINPLSSNLVNLLSVEPVASSVERIAQIERGEEFANLFSETFRTAGEANNADRESTVELLTGQTDDLSGLMLDIQKAELSLNLAIQIRNRVVDAYNEVMRMQV